LKRGFNSQKNEVISESELDKKIKKRYHFYHASENLSGEQQIQ